MGNNSGKIAEQLEAEQKEMTALAQTLDGEVGNLKDEVKNIPAAIRENVHFEKDRKEDHYF